MITILQVLQAAATAVETNGAIASFISTNYPGKSLSTFIGEDGVNPPGEANAPFVSFLPSPRTYDMGSGTTERTPAIEIEFGVLDSGKTVAGPRLTYNGLVNVDALGNLILAALNTAFAEQTVRVVDYAIDDSLRFPLCQAAMTVTFWFVQGSDEASLN